MEGEDVSVGRGARYRMEDVDAHALRFGALWRGNASENLSWRIGAAYERVFDGDAESTLNDVVPLKLDTPTLEGHYGIFEAGALMKPSASSPWSFDLSLKGSLRSSTPSEVRPILLTTQFPGMPQGIPKNGAARPIPPRRSSGSVSFCLFSASSQSGSTSAIAQISTHAPSGSSFVPSAMRAARPPSP